MKDLQTRKMVQLKKMILVHPKYEVLRQQYELFSFTPCKVVAPNLLYIILGFLAFFHFSLYSYCSSFLYSFFHSYCSSNYRNRDSLRSFLILKEKRFYDRETTSAAFCVIYQMSIKPARKDTATQISNPFLSSTISANHEIPEKFQLIEPLYLVFFNVHYNVHVCSVESVFQRRRQKLCKEIKSKILGVTIIFSPTVSRKVLLYKSFTLLFKNAEKYCKSLTLFFLKILG